jgi:hypothetical protein
MLSPDIIERLKREREEQDRPALRLPLYPSDEVKERMEAEEEEERSSRVIVIDLL